MDSAGDKYIETVDILLERLSDLAEQLEKDYSTFNGHDDANANNSDNKFFKTKQLVENGKSSNYFSDDMSNKHISLTKPTELASNIDKITNYRYSFYENSNKISIYVASSSVITQAVSFLLKNYYTLLYLTK